MQRAADVSARQLIATVAARLSAAGVPTPAVDAQLLVRHVTGWSATRIVTAGEDAVAAGSVAALEPLVRRREVREPLQLIVGSVGFRHLELEARPGVFIPRPETEVLVDEALARLPAGGIVVEPCTGTGAVACAVSLESDAQVIVATDISAAAVSLARANARRTSATVTVEQGDLLEPVAAALRGRVDVLVCNPPYLAAGELADSQPEVREWDPHAALVAGPTGHEVTDRLVAAAHEWLRPGGWLLLEVDSARADETAAGAERSGLRDAGVVRDLTGAPRIVIARRAG